MCHRMFAMKLKLKWQREGKMCATTISCQRVPIFVTLLAEIKIFPLDLRFVPRIQTGLKFSGRYWSPNLVCVRSGTRTNSKLDRLAMQQVPSCVRSREFCRYSIPKISCNRRPLPRLTPALAKNTTGE